MGSLLVHYSTDYVFDGAGSHARTEDEPTGAIEHLRTQQAGGRDRHPRKRLPVTSSFAQVGSTRREAATSPRRCCGWRKSASSLTVIDDQVGAPTSVPIFWQTARRTRCACASNARSLAGTYHLVADGETHLAWLCFARHRRARCKQG